MRVFVGARARMFVWVRDFVWVRVCVGVYLLMRECVCAHTHTFVFIFAVPLYVNCVYVECVCVCVCARAHLGACKVAPKPVLARCVRMILTVFGDQPSLHKRALEALSLYISLRECALPVCACHRKRNA